MIKNVRFIRLPLATAVAGVMFAQVAWATEHMPTAKFDTLVVTADKQGTKIKSDVVTLKDKDESTATDLRGLLSDEPSIEIGGGNGTSQYFYIRGMGQNSIDLKIDNGYTDTQTHYHQGRFMLDPALIKIVSVQKGAGSASAGIGATNGAIVARTVDAHDMLAGSDKDYGAKVNLGYASNDGHSYGVSAFGRTEMVDALMAVNRVDEDDYKAGDGYVSPKDGGDTVLYSGLDKVSYLAKVGVNLDNHRVTLSHLKEEHKGERAVREEFDWFDRQYPINRHTSTDNTNLEWTANDLGFVNALTSNVYQLNTTRKSDDDTQNGYAGNISGTTTVKTKTRGANVNFDTSVGDSTLVKYGVNYRHQETVPHKLFEETVARGNNPSIPLPPLQNQQKTDTGVYVEAISDINDVTLTAGMRYDAFEFEAMDGKKVSDGTLNPSLGVIWQPTAGLSLNAVHNYATRSPRLYDAILAGGNRGVVSIADGTKAERARNTEVGFNYRNNGLMLDGSYFWQRIDDALAAPERHTASTKLIANAGYIKNHGYELGAGYQFAGLTARIGVSESEPRLYDTRSDLMSSNPEYAIQSGRTWTGSLAYRFDNPNLELGVRHRQVEDVDNANILMRERDSKVLPRDGYKVSDLYANWKPYGNDRMNVNFAVNNVFDEYYRPHGQRAANTRTLPGAGRDFRVGVNYTF